LTSIASLAASSSFRPTPTRTARIADANRHRL
jgi:hypothetical protein